MRGMCATQRAGSGVKPLSTWVERVDPTAPVHKCRRNAIVPRIMEVSFAGARVEPCVIKVASVSIFGAFRSDRMLIWVIYLDHCAGKGTNQGRVATAEHTRCRPQSHIGFVLRRPDEGPRGAPRCCRRCHTQPCRGHLLDRRQWQAGGRGAQGPRHEHSANRFRVTEILPKVAKESLECPVHWEIILYTLTRARCGCLVRPR